MRLAAALVLAAGLLTPAAAQNIFTCVDAKGRRHTSDRPIVECLDREQRVLNRDGSMRQVVGPSLTAEERQRAEAREQQRQAERMRQLEIARRDRMLLARYPDEAVHQKAREAALQPAREAIQRSEQRIAQLEQERKPLLAEAEFYPKPPLPAKLKLDLEANEMAKQAQRDLIKNQQAEMASIQTRFDRELEHLRTLWAGTAPGRSANDDPPTAAR